MKKIRKGFTLVELLIVITIIGLLSAMMMVSSSEAQNAARVTKITEGFRSLSAAMMMYYNEDTAAADKLEDGEEATIITGTKRYIKNDDVFGESDTTVGAYYVVMSNGTWWLTYTLPSSTTTAALNTLLTKKAADLDLKSAAGSDPKTAAAYAGGGTIYFNVR